MPAPDSSSDSGWPECELSSPTDDATSFDDVIGILDALDPGNLLSGTLTYEKTKGSASRSFSWETPTAVAGEIQVAFRIKR